MKTSYNFRRNFYYDIENKINDFNAVILLGPEGAGKTVCMKQIEETHENAVYYDLRSMDEDDSIDLIDEIKDSIDRNVRKIYLIDETSYWTLPEKAIADIAHEYFMTDECSTKIILAGSQSAALEAWAGRAFAENAAFTNADFLSYPEWLAYKNMSEISAGTYKQFITGSEEFYKFRSLDMYLKYCSEKTKLSNYKTSNIIPDNNCDLLNVQTLKNILYFSFISQADIISVRDLSEADSLLEKTKCFLKNINFTDNEEVCRKAAGMIEERITAYFSTDLETLKQGYIFLQKHGLVTLNYNSENIPDITEELCRTDSDVIRNKNDLFCKINICIRYPMFITAILKEISGGFYSEKITDEISEYIAKCHARSILSEHIENIITARNEYHTDKNDMTNIPYYQLIFDNSK